MRGTTRHTFRVPGTRLGRPGTALEDPGRRICPCADTAARRRAHGRRTRGRAQIPPGKGTCSARASRRIGQGRPPHRPGQAATSARASRRAFRPAWAERLMQRHALGIAAACVDRSAQAGRKRHAAAPYRTRHRIGHRTRLHRASHKAAQDAAIWCGEAKRGAGRTARHTLLYKYEGKVWPVGEIYLFLHNTSTN